MVPPASRRGWSRAGPGLATVALLLCVLFSGGTNFPRIGTGAGPNEGRIVLVGSVALVAAGILAVLALWGRLPWPSVGRSGTWFLGALVALALWSGASLAWSVQADRSWDSANLALVYVAFAVLGLFAGVRLVAFALAAAFGLAVAWGLAGRVIPGLAPSGSTARVTGTIDYWNAFALMAASALPLGLWLAASQRLAVRLAGLLLVYGATVALLLTFSRGGIVVAAVAIGMWLLITHDRLESLGRLAIGAGAALVPALAGFALPGVSSEDQPNSVRVQDGALFGLALVAGAAAVVGVALYLRRHPVRLSAVQRDRLTRALVIGIPVAAVVVIGVGAALSTGPLTIQAGPGRFFRLGSSDRWQWWGESLDVFRDHPIVGAGAGTFSIARRPFAGDTTSFASEPHNLPLQFLAELGVVGLVLFALLLVAAGFVVVRAVRRLRGEEGLAARALAAICAAWFVHAFVEFDWEYVALTGPVVLVVSSLAAAGRKPRERAPARLLAIAAVAVVAAAVFSVATPWAADQRLNDSNDAASAEDFARAAQAAEDAHSLNPLSAEALLAWAFAEDALGLQTRGAEAIAHRARAYELYRQATDLQPENPRTWRARGQFELDTLQDPVRAVVSLERALALDPRDRTTRRLLAEANGRG